MHFRRTFAAAATLAIFVCAGNSNAASGASPGAHAAGARSSANGLLQFSFENAEITKVISIYAKASGTTFIVDPTVRGKISIYTPKPVSLENAFALLSTALAVNQFAIVEQGDTMVVMSTRNAQRSMVQVTSELPAIKPERMVSMIFRLKYVSAEEINKRLRILPSKDGEMTPFGADRLLVTDWVTNINRIAKFVEELDQPGAEKLSYPRAKKPAPGQDAKSDVKFSAKPAEPSPVPGAEAPDEKD